MKKLAVVIVIALVVAAAVWVVLRIQLARQVAAVPQLLPETTLVLLQVPDLKKTRKEWHESDLYQLWREPAVQEWLQKPLARLPQSGGGARSLADFLALEPRHSFLALTSLERNEPKLIGGFHFEASAEKAREFIGQREAELLAKTKSATRETVVYGQHKIETVRVSRFAFASVYDNHWYFVANDLAVLKGLLDRVDHRVAKGDRSLEQNAAYAAAVKHLPGDYAGMLFLEPQPFVQKLIPLVAMTGQSLPMDQLQRLQQVQSVAAALVFEHGKMRETDIATMPEVSAEKKLERRLLPAAGANTFLYSDSRLHWSDNLLASSAPEAMGLPALVQQFTSAVKAKGISIADLRQAFGEELEVVADWSPQSRWPTLLAALPVKDPSRARQVAGALTSVEIGGAPWTRTEENGVTFFRAEPFSGFIPLHPAIAVSDRFILVGSEATAVSGMLTRLAQPAGELAKSAAFHGATAELPAADSAFNYIDTRLLYERTDAAARPLLLMGAAFYPALQKTVDLTRLPPVEAIAGHLSPIVMSQRYETDGYVTESIGPVTFREATIGVAAAVGGLLIYLREGLRNGDLWSNHSTPAAAPAASVSPTPTPF